MITPLSEANRRRLEQMSKGEWVPGIKRYVEPPDSMGFEVRALALAEHHEKETKYLMKTIRNLAAEVLSAHERPSIDAPYMELQKRADLLMMNASTEVGRLADIRLQRLALWFKAVFPKRRLHIVFGMGSESIYVDEFTVCLHIRGDQGGPYADILDRSWAGIEKGSRHRHFVRCLQEISNAMVDVCFLTDWYRNGCPSDLTVEPTE